VVPHADENADFAAEGRLWMDGEYMGSGEHYSHTNADVPHTVGKSPPFPPTAHQPVNVNSIFLF